MALPHGPCPGSPIREHPGDIQENGMELGPGLKLIPAPPLSSPLVPGNKDNTLAGDPLG